MSLFADKPCLNRATDANNCSVIRRLRQGFVPENPHFEGGTLVSIVTSDELLLQDPGLQDPLTFDSNRLKEYFFYGNNTQKGVLVLALTADDFERWLESDDCQVRPYFDISHVPLTFVVGLG